VSNEHTKKAVEMLLKGATLVSEPCPYCKGVRVVKDGHAFCVSCGREPEKRKVSSETESKPKKDDDSSVLQTLEKKLEELAKEFEKEKDHTKQQEVLKAINSLVEIIGRLKSQ
jgi:UPF0148 protein